MINVDSNSVSHGHIRENIDQQSCDTATGKMPTVNRRTVMNMMVSAAALSIAEPVAAEVISPPISFDPQYERLASAIDALRSSFVCEGWTLDEVGARKALQYFKEAPSDDGMPDDDPRWRETLEFMDRHGLSYEWIIGGRLGHMICSLAKSAFVDQSPDPIFAAIEAHKAAHATFNRANQTRNDLEDTLPKEVTKSSISEFERNIVSTDAPEFINAVISEWETSGIEVERSHDLINIAPTTVRGAEALLRYVVEVEQKIGEWWPREGFADEEIIGRNGKPREFTWHHFVCQSVLNTLSTAHI